LGLAFAILFSILIFSIPIIQHASAVDYRDSTGYTPSWAKGSGYHTVLLKCNGLIGDYSRDGDWCFEWIAYVLDQGIENFPESTSENTKSSSPSFTLEDGPLYSGPLTKFFPNSFTFGDDWLVGKPFTFDQKEALSKVGVVDIASQRIVVPDQIEDSKFLRMSYIITQLDSTTKAKQLYEQVKNGIKSKNYPTESEYFEFEEKGISSNNLELEKTSKFFVADCIGVMKNFYEYNEEGVLTCIKDNYIIATNAAWTNDVVYNDHLYSNTPEVAVANYVKIIINKIDNDLHTNPQVHFPNDAQYVAFQYTMEEISDDEILSYFQKSILEEKISLPTDDIVIDENFQRLSYIPDLPRISIYSWARGLSTDGQFAENMKWMVEKGYLTVPGLDSSSITVSQEEKPAFFDMEEETPTKASVTIESEEQAPRFEDVEDDETPVWAIGLAVFVVFGIPAIIIGLIIWKIKRKKTEMHKLRKEQWGGI